MEFWSVLRSLAEESSPLKRDLVVMLSCPTREESEAFAACWGQISQSRRKRIIAWMVELAEERFDLDYVTLFRHCLSDADPAVRRHAIEGLREDESADLVEPLLELLSSDPDPQVRAAAAMSVGKFLFLAECDELDHGRGELIRQRLERTIEDPDEDTEVVRRAIESIAFINDDPVRRIIDRAYDHGDRGMRESALFAMGRSADPFWVDTVLAELYAESPALRYEAARACGELELSRAVKRLIDLLADPDRKVRSMAVWALGQIGGDLSQKVLESLVDSEDDMLSASASEALDEMRFLTRPIDVLVCSVEESDPGEVEFATGDERCESAGLDGNRQHDDAWGDDFIDLN